MFFELKSNRFLDISILLCIVLFISSSQSGSQCFWSKCFLSPNGGNPCPSDYTNSTSKSCFWGSGTMYQCCKIEMTTVSSGEETDITSSTDLSTDASEMYPTEESSHATSTSGGSYETVATSTVVQDLPTESSTAASATSEPVNLLQCEEVKTPRYPFIVSLMENKDNTTFHFCSGAILSEWYVATSASCVVNKRASAIEASAADLHLTEFEFTEQTVMVRKIHIHNDYKPEDPTKKSDLALLEMKHPFRMWSEYVQPVRMAPDPFDTQDFTGTVFGWEIEDLNGSGSPILRKVDIPFVRREECAELYRDHAQPIGESKIDINKQLCAASNPSHKECKEDFGSPLVTVSDGTLYIIGVSSIHSDSLEIPNVYTDISYFRDYILSVILSRK